MRRSPGIHQAFVGPPAGAAFSRAALWFCSSMARCRRCINCGGGTSLGLSWAPVAPQRCCIGLVTGWGCCICSGRQPGDCWRGATAGGFVTLARSQLNGHHQGIQRHNHPFPLVFKRSRPERSVCRFAPWAQLQTWSVGEICSYLAVSEWVSVHLRVRFIHIRPTCIKSFAFLIARIDAAPKRLANSNAHVRRRCASPGRPIAQCQSPGNAPVSPGRAREQSARPKSPATHR